MGMALSLFGRLELLRPCMGASETHTQVFALLAAAGCLPELTFFAGLCCNNKAQARVWCCQGKWAEHEQHGQLGAGLYAWHVQSLGADCVTLCLAVVQKHCPVLKQSAEALMQHT